MVKLIAIVVFASFIRAATGVPGWFRKTGPGLHPTAISNAVRRPAEMDGRADAVIDARSANRIDSLADDERDDGHYEERSLFSCSLLRPRDDADGRGRVLVARNPGSIAGTDGSIGPVLDLESKAAERDMTFEGDEHDGEYRNERSLFLNSVLDHGITNINLWKCLG